MDVKLLGNVSIYHLFPIHAMDDDFIPIIQTLRVVWQVVISLWEETRRVALGWLGILRLLIQICLLSILVLASHCRIFRRRPTGRPRSAHRQQPLPGNDAAVVLD